MSAVPPSSPRRRAGLAVLGAALAAFLLESWEMGAQYDDAYISYRYAANWLAGDGLVFNPGEYVEGFSNLLWTLLVAAGMALGVPAKAVGHGLGLASGVGTLVGTYLYARALRPERPVFAGLAVCVVYSTPSFERWAISGMETPMFSAWIVAAFAAEARARPRLATGFAALAMLTRPEGALVAASLFGFRALALGLRDARVWGHALAYAALCGALTAFRLAYYGEPLPNTFYAKVGGVWLGTSVFSTGVFLAGSGGLLLLPGLALARERRLAWPGAAFVLVFLAYLVYVGGTQRYLAPVVPCIAALGSAGLAARWPRGRLDRAAVAGYLALTLVVDFFGLALLNVKEFDQVFGSDSRWHGVAAERSRDANGEQLAATRTRLLRERGEPIARVATGGIGALGFYSGLPIVDILGVVDPVVARTPVRAGGAFSLPGHQRSNPDYVFSREPDYILIGKGDDPKQPDWVPAVNDLRRHPEMARRYVWDPKIIGYRRVR